MSRLITFFLSGIIFISCSKTELKPEINQPQMLYTELNEAEVKYGHPISVDVDHDGANDFSFGVILVGDPVLIRDRLQFLAMSKINTNLLNNEQDESPRLNKGELISFKHHGYNWFEISSIVMAEKLTEMTGFPYWDGIWKSASHKFLPIQLKKSGGYYQGWIELSFDQAGEKILLHKAAVSKEPGKDVKAGY